MNSLYYVPVQPYCKQCPVLVDYYICASPVMLPYPPVPYPYPLMQPYDPYQQFALMKSENQPPEMRQQEPNPAQKSNNPVGIKIEQKPNEPEVKLAETHPVKMEAKPVTEEKQSPEVAKSSADDELWQANDVQGQKNTSQKKVFFSMKDIRMQQDQQFQKFKQIAKKIKSTKHTEKTKTIRSKLAQVPREYSSQIAEEGSAQKQTKKTKQG